MRRALLAVALVALLVGVPVAVLAQDGEAPATKVVFALDDSGSMFGPNGSDPGMQRYDGVINLIEVLQRLLDDDDPRRVEVGAISFGSDAQQLSGLVSVRDTALADLLRSARDGASTRRSTDFLGALCLAWETATGAAAPRDSGCPNATGAGGQRADDARRIVVLVTDGAPASGSDALTFGAQPDPASCPSVLDASAFRESRDEGAADDYLCALGTVWASLIDHTRVTLIVIGLDQQGSWFDSAAPYWRRAVGCSLDPAVPCDRVIRSVDADELAEQILGAYPTIDLCERVAGSEEYNCDVPGGLVEVQFLMTGLPDDAVTTVDNGRDLFRSDGRDAEDLLTRLPGSHGWQFENRPYRGAYELTLQASTPSPDARVFVDYEPARFSIGEQAWDADSSALTIDLRVVGGGSVFPRSAEQQPYRVVIDGSTQQTVTLEHVEGGRDFTVTMDAFPGDAEFTLCLDLGRGRGCIKVARGGIAQSVFVSPTPEPTPAAPVETATPTPTPSPTPTPTPTPTPPVIEEEPEESGFPWVLLIVIAIIVVLLAPVAISAYEVRQPKVYNRHGEKAKPVNLAVPDAGANPQDLVRLGVFAWREAPSMPPQTDERLASRTVMLRYLVAGPLVARRTNRLGEDWRGASLAEAPELDLDAEETPLDIAEDLELHARREQGEDEW